MNELLGCSIALFIIACIFCAVVYGLFWTMFGAFALVAFVFKAMALIGGVIIGVMFLAWFVKNILR